MLISASIIINNQLLEREKRQKIIHHFHFQINNILSNNTESPSYNTHNHHTMRQKRFRNKLQQHLYKIKSVRVLYEDKRRTRLCMD